MKNAEVKSKEEALKRMIDGETFYLSTLDKGILIICFDTITMRFISIYGLNNSIVKPITIEFVEKYFKEFISESPWYNNIPTCGKLCWVTNSSSESLKPRKIVGYKSTQVYLDSEGEEWLFAYPIKNTREYIW